MRVKSLSVLLLRLFHKRFIDSSRLRLFFFEPDHPMAGRVAPGRHVLLDTFVVRDDFKDLAQRQLFDLFRSHDNRHRAKVPERIWPLPANLVKSLERFSLPPEAPKKEGDLL